MIFKYWTIAKLRFWALLIETYFFLGYQEPTSSPPAVQRDADSPHSKRRRMLHFPDPTICNERTEPGFATVEVDLYDVFIFLRTCKFEGKKQA